VSFLNRPEVAAAIATALADEAGRPVRCRLVAAPGGDPRTKGPHRDTAAPLRATAAVSQAELLRAATEHPLVAHARDLFDAAIRRVEQRPRVADPPPADVAAIDAQGAEMNILRGAERLLRGPCIGLHMELFTLPLYKGISLLPEVQAHCAALGYQLVKKFPAHGSFDSQHDCLFLRDGADAALTGRIRQIYGL
jgi:hypothetical protein